MDTTGAVLEITVATVATLLATVLAAFLVARALPRLPKALLLVIALSMFLSSSCTVIHVIISSFINSNATILNLRIAQSIGIQSKTIALLLLLIERLSFIALPTFRENVILRSVFLSIAIVAFIVGFQRNILKLKINFREFANCSKQDNDGPSTGGSAGKRALFLQLCVFGQFASRKFYKSTFAIASGSAYNAFAKLLCYVSETIELTRVIFPICAVDSILSIIAIIFSFLMSGKTIDYKTYTPIARWISTIQSLCATILILGRHRLFIRRIREILGLKGLEKSRKMKPVDKHNESDKYFEMFRTQW
ncbi:hypothetical protein PRIPAC_71868 [Pristionchus pacificus]|uniref:Uncharacterized protein n=1 Tax=Pristionchus pacificus TaxID=54126 RepID=A0A2A6D0B6_PRIPA|nr:hypothetical protein PRIPAC_71868 [Pristionchus pacificus]|eukprot:PDM83713.1 hypothetical protein PRIPAC_30200 [Pristionchus pacificus]